MNSIIYVGMDVHSKTFTLCCYTIEEEKIFYTQTINADYKQVLSYLERVRSLRKEEIEFVCGYEAGCLGYTLYHQLTSHNVKCIILAPSTMAVAPGDKKKKTDSRDAAMIARCLAYHSYHPVHIPTDQDEQVKEYIRMRDDHKLALKKIKQQINAFCLRHGCQYSPTKDKWTQAHVKWLHTLQLSQLYREILDEYLATYSQLTDKIERYDQRIEELAKEEPYREGIQKLNCLLGIKTHTALTAMVEVGDYKRFPNAGKFAAYLGLVPGENSSGDKQTYLSITKAGNSHLRRLLVEAAQGYGRGKPGVKTKRLKQKQAGNRPEVIAYADRANERLRRKYYHMVLSGKKANVAKTAIARELACFIWGMMTENIGC